MKKINWRPKKKTREEVLSEVALNIINDLKLSFEIEDFARVIVLIDRGALMHVKACEESADNALNTLT